MSPHTALRTTGTARVSLLEASELSAAVLPPETSSPERLKKDVELSAKAPSAVAMGWWTMMKWGVKTHETYWTARCIYIPSFWEWTYRVTIIYHLVYLIWSWRLAMQVHSPPRISSRQRPGDSEDGRPFWDLSRRNHRRAEPSVGHWETAGHSNFVPSTCASLLLLLREVVQGQWLSVLRLYKCCLVGGVCCFFAFFVWQRTLQKQLHGYLFVPTHIVVDHSLSALAPCATACRTSGPCETVVEPLPCAKLHLRLATTDHLCGLLDTRNGSTTSCNKRWTRRLWAAPWCCIIKSPRSWNVFREFLGLQKPCNMNLLKVL